MMKKATFVLPLLALFLYAGSAKAFFSCNYADEFGYSYPLESEYDNNNPKGWFRGGGWYNLFDKHEDAMAAAKYSCEKNSPSKGTCVLAGCSRN